MAMAFEETRKGGIPYEKMDGNAAAYRLCGRKEGRSAPHHFRLLASFAGNLNTGVHFMKKIWFVILSAVGILLLVWGAVLNATESSTLGIIGGADGPTAIFVTGSTGGHLAAILMVLGGVTLAGAAIAYLKKKH